MASGMALLGGFLSGAGTSYKEEAVRQEDFKRKNQFASDQFMKDQVLEGLRHENNVTLRTMEHTQQTALQGKTQEFQGEQGELNRAAQADLAEAQRLHTAALQESSQTFKAGESEKDRTQQEKLSNRQMLFQKYLQDDSQTHANNMQAAQQVFQLTSMEEQKVLNEELAEFKSELQEDLIKSKSEYLSKDEEISQVQKLYKTLSESNVMKNKKDQLTEEQLISTAAVLFNQMKTDLDSETRVSKEKGEWGIPPNFVDPETGKKYIGGNPNEQSSWE